MAAGLAAIQLLGGQVARPVAAAHALMALIALAALGDRLLLLAVAVAVPAMMVSWRAKDSTSLRIAAAVALCAYVGVLRDYQWSRELPGFVGLIGLIAFPWLIAIALPHGLSIKPRYRQWQRRGLAAKVGMILALSGIGLTLIGGGSELAFTSRIVVTARPGTMVPVGPWLVQFATVNPIAGSGWTAVEAALRASRGRGVSELRPQSRTMIGSVKQASEPAIANFWDGELLTAIEPARDGGWRLRLVWTPLVFLPWLGGVLVASGGLIVLAGIGWRSRRRRRAREA